LLIRKEKVRELGEDRR